MDQTQMQIYYVMDQEAQMPVSSIRGPAGWKVESNVQWTLQNLDLPAVVTCHPHQLQRQRALPGISRLQLLLARWKCREQIRLVKYNLER